MLDYWAPNMVVYLATRDKIQKGHGTRKQNCLICHGSAELDIGICLFFRLLTASIIDLFQAIELQRLFLNDFWMCSGLSRGFIVFKNK